MTAWEGLIGVSVGVSENGAAERTRLACRTFRRLFQALNLRKTRQTPEI
jgi:hypothetical protein